MAIRADVDIIKQVGLNGQVSLGKEYAGKQIQISKLEDGTLIIKTGKFIPDNERWLYTGNNLEKIEKAKREAKKIKRRDNFDEIRELIERA